MKIKNNRGYSLIEIGIGLLIITIFSIFSLALFNGCYNNHHVIQQRNIALSHAINTMEKILQTQSLAALGFEDNMLSRTSILQAAKSATSEERLEGNYAVPEDEKIQLDNNMAVTTKYRRVPTTSANEAMDNTVLKVSVIVEYKVRVNDTQSRTIELESLKITK